MDIIPRLVEWLPLYGPWLIFGFAVMETCFVTGMVFPSGLATSVATVLALEGTVAMAPFVTAAVAGGFVGDTVGFWIGRGAREHLAEGRGWVSRWFLRHQGRTQRFYGKHPVYSVTVARLVSFVRTVMPMAAGMTDLTYRRYLAYEVPGLLGWAAIYVGIGVATGESWELAVRAIGLGGTVIFVVVGVAFWVAMRGRKGRPAAEEASC